MKILNIQEEQSHFVLTISSNEDLFENLFKSHFLAVSKNVSITGFRKGRAPVDLVIKTLINRGTIQREYDKISSKIIDKLSVELGQNEEWKEKIFQLAFERKVKQFSTEKWEFIFEAKFEKIPSVILGDYSTIYTLLEDKVFSDSLCPVSKDGEATNKDVVAVSMVGKGPDGEEIGKYTYDLIEIDLETTKIKKEIVDAIVGSKAKDKKEIVFTDSLFGEVKLELLISEVREKNDLNDELLKKLKIPENVTLEQFKESFLKQYEMHNKFVKHQDVLKWVISRKNVVDPTFPIENIRFEAAKVFRYLQKIGRRDISFEKILLDHIKNLKISLVVREIAKKENIEANEADKEEFVKDIEENPWMYGNRNPEQILNVDEEIVKEYVLQFKVLKFLCSKLSFSS